MAVLSIWLTGLLVCLAACETSIGRQAETGTAFGSSCSTEEMTSALQGTDSVMDSLRGREALAQAELDADGDKQETAAYQNWTCFSRDETEGGALAPELTEEEIILRLFHSFLGSR